VIIETSSAAPGKNSVGRRRQLGRAPHPTRGPDEQSSGITKPRRRGLILLFLACTYLVGLIAVWLTMRLAGDRVWIGTVLLLAPRWPFATPLVVLWPCALFARRWELLAATILSTGAALFLVMGFRLSLAGQGRGDIRLLTCNVHRQHFDPGQLSSYIAEVDPDIIALQGWSEASRESLFGDAAWHIQTVGELLVASRFPIQNAKPLSISEGTDVPKGEQGVAVAFEVNTGRGPVCVVTLHLASPHAGLVTMNQDSGEKLAANIERRWRESARLLRSAQGIQLPLIIAGDFNTTDESPIFREHWGRYQDAFTQRGTGLGYTYIIGHTQLRIDHILAGPTWRVSGSAHRPLVADLIGR
jgi:endonuclease/exonuclease/phosphatase (EEP) superfamily protein YafD